MRKITCQRRVTIDSPAFDVAMFLIVGISGWTVGPFFNFSLVILALSLCNR